MTPATLAIYLREYRVPFPVGVDVAGSGDPIPQTMRAYKMQGTPTTLLVDASGRLRKHHFGMEDDARLICRHRSADCRTRKALTGRRRAGEARYTAITMPNTATYCAPQPCCSRASNLLKRHVYVGMCGHPLPQTQRQNASAGAACQPFYAWRAHQCLGLQPLPIQNTPMPQVAFSRLAWHGRGHDSPARH